MCIVSSSLTLIALLLLFALRRAISLAIQLVKEAADVIRTVPQIVFLTAAPVILYVGISMYFAIFSVYLASCGEIKDGELIWDRELRYSMIFHTCYVLWLVAIYVFVFPPPFIVLFLSLSVYISPSLVIYYQNWPKAYGCYWSRPQAAPAFRRDIIIYTFLSFFFMQKKKIGFSSSFLRCTRSSWLE